MKRQNSQTSSQGGDQKEINFNDFGNVSDLEQDQDCDSQKFPSVVNLDENNNILNYQNDSENSNDQIDAEELATRIQQNKMKVQQPQKHNQRQQYQSNQNYQDIQEREGDEEEQEQAEQQEMQEQNEDQEEFESEYDEQNNPFQNIDLNDLNELDFEKLTDEQKYYLQMYLAQQGCFQQGENEEGEQEYENEGEGEEEQREEGDDAEGVEDQEEEEEEQLEDLHKFKGMQQNNKNNNKNAQNLRISETNKEKQQTQQVQKQYVKQQDDQEQEEDDDDIDIDEKMLEKFKQTIEQSKQESINTQNQVYQNLPPQTQQQQNQKASLSAQTSSNDNLKQIQQAERINQENQKQILREQQERQNIKKNLELEQAQKLKQMQQQQLQQELEEQEQARLIQKQNQKLNKQTIQEQQNQDQSSKQNQLKQKIEDKEDRFQQQKFQNKQSNQGDSKKIPEKNVTSQQSLQKQFQKSNQLQEEQKQNKNKEQQQIEADQNIKNQQLSYQQKLLQQQQQQFQQQQNQNKLNKQIIQEESQGEEENDPENQKDENEAEQDQDQEEDEQQGDDQNKDSQQQLGEFLLHNNCTIHLGEPCIYFCQTCKVFNLCLHCISTGKHANHDIRDLKGSVQQFQENMQSALYVLKERCEFLSIKDNIIVSRGKEVETYFNDMNNFITRKLSEAQQFLEKQEQSFRAQLDGVSKSTIRSFEKDQDQLKQELENYKNLFQLYAEVLETGNWEIIYHFYKENIKQIDDLNNQSISNYYSSSTVNAYKSINFKKEDLQNNKELQNILKEIKVFTKNVQETTSSERPLQSSYIPQNEGSQYNSHHHSKERISHKSTNHFHKRQLSNNLSSKQNSDKRIIEDYLSEQATANLDNLKSIMGSSNNQSQKYFRQFNQEQEYAQTNNHFHQKNSQLFEKSAQKQTNTPLKEPPRVSAMSMRMEKIKQDLDQFFDRKSQSPEKRFSSNPRKDFNLSFQQQQEKNQYYSRKITPVENNDRTNENFSSAKQYQQQQYNATKKSSEILKKQQLQKTTANLQYELNSQQQNLQNNNRRQQIDADSFRDNLLQFKFQQLSPQKNQIQFSQRKTNTFKPYENTNININHFNSTQTLKQSPNKFSSRKQSYQHEQFSKMPTTDYASTSKQKAIDILKQQKKIFQFNKRNFYEY